jgi:hypothetical protein
LEAVIAMTIDSISWQAFHRLVGLEETPAIKSRENANIALATGKAIGIPVFDSSNPNAAGWDYGNNKNFLVKHP